MPVTVNWMGRASDKVSADLLPQFTVELQAAFPHATLITAYDCFMGFSADQARKIALGVEVRSPEAYRMHIVKLGACEVVANDYDGWRKFVLAHNFASRIFVSLEKRELPGSPGPVAIVYQDAYTLFGADAPTPSVQPLETVTAWAIQDDTPDAASVEQGLLPVEKQMISPTLGVPTHYTIYPVDVGVDPAQREPLCERVAGQWLTCEQAIDHPQVSPTAWAMCKMLLTREQALDAQYATHPANEYKPETPRHLFREVPAHPTAVASVISPGPP